MMSETIATAQADTDHTARYYAALLTLADVPAVDLAAWINNTDADLTLLTLAVMPVGTGFVVTFADDLDGRPVASTVAVPAGTTPSDFDLPDDLVSHAHAVARGLNERWVHAQRAADAKSHYDDWVHDPGWDEA